MRDVDADYKAAYEAEYEALTAAGHTKAAERIAVILGRKTGTSKPRQSNRGKEAASTPPETADEK